MASTLVVPLLVLVEHVNIHQQLGVSQHAAWGPEQRSMKRQKYVTPEDDSAPQVSRCPIYYCRRTEKYLQKE